MSTTPSQGWLASPVRHSTNAAASTYKNARWLKSHATRWDYEVTRRTLLEELRPLPDDRVLEIGCGPGTWTREVAPLCSHVTAVDISENMIAEAREYTRSLPVAFVHSDFLQLSTEDRFDRVFSARAFEYIRPMSLVASKVSRLLMPGGTVVIITKPKVSFWRGRTRLLYRTWPFDVLNGTRAERAGRGKSFETLRQYPSTPAQIANEFRPYGLHLRRVRPVVMRLPIFRGGFHEYPLVPQWMAPPLLSAFSVMFRMSSAVPRRMSEALLLFSESYCVTLELNQAHAARKDG